MGKVSLEKRLTQERARALATVQLMRHAGLALEDAGTRLGFDLLVTVENGSGSPRRQFGVELRGRMSKATKKEADQVLRPTLEQLKRVHFVLPVCVVFYTMEDDSGWYFWAAEPVITPEGQAKLPFAGRPDCRPFDNSATEAIVRQVEEWYDALYQNLSAPAR